MLPVTLARRLRQRFPATRIINTYEPTEATMATTWIVVDDAVLAGHARLPIGRAKRDAEVFVDEGELCIAGAHVMRGYLNREDLNAGRMFTRHASVHSARAIWARWKATACCSAMAGWTTGSRWAATGSN